MSSDFHFTTKENRFLLNFLKSAGGPLIYTEIVKELEKRKVCSRSKTNGLLNVLSEKGLVFRIEKGNNVFYRLNDFPEDVKVLLSGLDAMAKKEPEMEWMFEAWKKNILTLYPKMDMDKIADLTLFEVKAKYEKDSFMQNVIAKFKEMME